MIQHASPHEPPTPHEAEVLRQLRAVRFGHVVVQIHDARIVQIERTDRHRTDHRQSGAAESRRAADH
jgi:hypothetical protein